MQKHIFNQIFSSLTGFLTVFMAGIWAGWSSAVIPKLRAGKTPISTTSDDISWIVALLDLGHFLTPIPTGLLLDRCGRILAIRLAFVGFVLASTLALWATAAYYLYLARLLAGMAKGVSITVATIYVAELASPKIRGALSAIFMVMYSGGASISMTFGPYISFNALNWTTFCLPIVGFFLTFFIVESPYYFLVRKNEILATVALSRVRPSGETTSSSAELQAIKEKIFSNDAKDSKGFFCFISEKANRKALLITLTTKTLMRTGGTSWMWAYPSTTLPADTFWDPKVSVMIYSWCNLFSGLLGMSLIDRLGRKPLLLISASALFLATGMSALFYYYQKKTELDVSGFVFVPHIGLIIFGIFCPIGVGQVPTTFQGELFPVNFRSQASALGVIALGFNGFVINKIHSSIDHVFGIYFMYVIFAISHFAIVVFSIFCVFETKGKTLAEIQDILSR